jgi:hypothetical protein
MIVQKGEFENEADQILNEAVSSFFGEEKDSGVVEAKDEIEVEQDNSEVEVINNNVEEVETELTEVSEEDEAKDEVTEDDIVENNDKEEIDLNEQLRGMFSKDYINLLESVEDPKLRGDLIEAGKKQRADLDRKRLELGETKKLVEVLDEEVKNHNLGYNRQQYADVVKNFMSLDALYKQDPKLAIESLAKNANIDLSQFSNTSNKSVQDDDLEDYRTPEEIETSNKLKALEQELNLLKSQKQQEEQITVQQEIFNFANAADSNGNLQHPYFNKQSIRNSMSLLMNADPTIDMEKAYQRAILLDDELVQEKEREIERRLELKRKAEIDKAKKLKKQSIRSSKVNSVVANPDANLERIVADFMA